MIPISFRALIPIWFACSLVLIPAAPDPDCPAAHALVEQLAEEQVNPKGEDWSPTVKKLVALGDAAIPELVRGMESPNRQISGGCCTALTLIGGPAIDIFIRKLASEEPGTKLMALKGLVYARCRTHDQVIKVSRILMPFSRDKDPEAREWAVRGLGWSGKNLGREGVECIIGALEDSSPSVKRTAALALRGTEDDIAGPALMKALDSDDPELRFSAVQAIGFRHRDPGAFQALTQHQHDPSAKVRKEIVNSLALIGGKRGIKHLVAFLDDNGSSSTDSPAEAAASLIGEMIGRRLNHSRASVEEIKGWWESTGSSLYGGLEVPER